jgi:hypothetical protein
MRIGCDCLPESIQLLIFFVDMALPIIPSTGRHVSIPVRTVLYSAWVVFYPLICILHETHVQSHERRDGYLQSERKPRSIHPRFRRRRALSRVDLDKDRLNDCCKLLSLPREVRDIIWKEVLEDMVVHLWAYDGKFGGAKCQSNDPTCLAKCMRRLQECNGRCGFMGLLSSCRQM